MLWWWWFTFVDISFLEFQTLVFALLPRHSVFRELRWALHRSRSVVLHLWRCVTRHESRHSGASQGWWTCCSGTAGCYYQQVQPGAEYWLLPEIVQNIYVVSKYCDGPESWVDLWTHCVMIQAPFFKRSRCDSVKWPALHCVSVSVFFFLLL